MFKKTERQSSILLESGNLNVSQQESNRQTYNESGEQGDKEGFHQFGLDLELPHPDHYLPETGLSFVKITLSYPISHYVLFVCPFRSHHVNIFVCLCINYNILTLVYVQWIFRVVLVR